MTSPPLVSVILPTFNRLRYLPDTIASIFGQTFHDWELLIADDGSDAQTRGYLETLADPPRVRLIELAHTGRPAIVRNTALREAKGTYVAFMDSDDIWMPTKLETQIASLRIHAECGWSQTKFVLVNAGLGSTREMPAVDGWILGPLLRTETVIALPSVVASRTLLDEVGRFDEALVTCEDYDLWLRLAVHSPVDAIDETLTIVRRHEDHYGTAAISFRDSIRVLDKVLESGMAGPYESFVHKERANSWGSLAKCHAISGDRHAAFRTLLASAPASWRHVRWWTEALQAAAVMSVPRELRKIVRGRKSPGH